MAYFFIVFHAFDTPVRRSLSEYCDAIRYEETRMVSLPDDEKSLRICLTVSTEYHHVTDRQTDILRQHTTSPHYAKHNAGKIRLR